MIDIISMVKHAAKEQAPLLTAEERVHHAFEKVSAGKTFDEEQSNWLERIRSHLIENLSIDRDDFENMPVLARHGGWGRANKAFKGQLENLIRHFNEAIAA